MTDHPDQGHRDEWQTRLNEAAYKFSAALRELEDANPWPNQPMLEQAMNTLATELWDRSFSLTGITAAFEAAAADLPRYAGGQEVRS